MRAKTFVGIFALAKSLYILYNASPNPVGLVAPLFPNLNGFTSSLVNIFSVSVIDNTEIVPVSIKVAPLVTQPICKFYISSIARPRFSPVPVIPPTPQPVCINRHVLPNFEVPAPKSPWVIPPPFPPPAPKSRLPPAPFCLPTDEPVGPSWFERIESVLDAVDSWLQFLTLPGVFTVLWHLWCSLSDRLYRRQGTLENDPKTQENEPAEIALSSSPSPNPVSLPSADSALDSAPDFLAASPHLGITPFDENVVQPCNASPDPLSLPSTDSALDSAPDCLRSSPYLGIAPLDESAVPPRNPSPNPLLLPSSDSALDSAPDCLPASLSLDITPFDESAVQSCDPCPNPLPSMDSASDSAPDCLPASPSLGITSLSEIAIQTDPVQETEADDPSLLELVSAMSAMNINQSVQASVSNMAPNADVDNVDGDVPYISFNGAILLLDRKDVKVITPSVIDEVTPTLLSTTSDDVAPSDPPRKKRVRTRKAPTLATPSSSSDSTILNPSSSLSNPPANTAIVSTKVETSEAPVHPAKAAQDFVEVSAQISEWQVVRRRTRRPNRSIVHHGAVEPAPAAGDVPSNANPSYPKSASTSAPPVVAVPSNQPLRVEHAPRMAIAGPSMQTSSERRHPSTSTSHNARPITSSYSRSSTSMHAPSVVNTPSNPSGPVELAPGMAIARGPLLQTSSENRHRSTYPPTSLSAHPMAMEPRPHESFTRATALATPQEQSSRSSASSRWAPQTPPAQPSSSSSAASIWAPRTPHVSAFTFRHPSLPPRPEHPLGISSSMWAHGNLQSTEPVADPSEAPRTKRPTRRHGRGRFRPSRADRWAQQEPNQPHHDS